MFAQPFQIKMSDSPRPYTQRQIRSWYHLCGRLISFLPYAKIHPSNVTHMSNFVIISIIKYNHYGTDKLNLLWMSASSVLFFCSVVGNNTWHVFHLFGLCRVIARYHFSLTWTSSLSWLADTSHIFTSQRRLVHLPVAWSVCAARTWITKRSPGPETR